MIHVHTTRVHFLAWVALTVNDDGRVFVARGFTEAGATRNLLNALDANFNSTNSTK